MTNEKAIKHLEVIKGDCALVGDVRALDMAILALSTEGEYIKKEDAISKILIEFTERESNGKVVCACADVKQTCADILDGLPTYSIPDSADDNTMEWHRYYRQNGNDDYCCSKCKFIIRRPNILRCKYCPNCGRKAVNK